MNSYDYDVIVLGAGSPGVDHARNAAAAAEVDVAAALAYRDYMVSDHTDAGQVKWLTGPKSTSPP